MSHEQSEFDTGWDAEYSWSNTCILTLLSLQIFTF